MLFPFHTIFPVTYGFHYRPGKEMRAGEGAQSRNVVWVTTRLSNSMKQDCS